MVDRPGFEPGASAMPSSPVQQHHTDKDGDLPLIYRPTEED